MSNQHAAEPWINSDAWQAAISQFGLTVIADCTCQTPGPTHTSVTDLDGSIIAVCACTNCGAIISTGGDNT